MSLTTTRFIIYTEMIPLVTGAKTFTLVPSETRRDKAYRVDLSTEGPIKCNCPDAIFRHHTCKHVRYAVEGKYERGQKEAKQRDR